MDARTSFAEAAGLLAKGLRSIIALEALFKNMPPPQRQTITTDGLRRLHLDHADDNNNGGAGSGGAHRDQNSLEAWSFLVAASLLDDAVSSSIWSLATGSCRLIQVQVCTSSINFD